MKAAGKFAGARAFTHSHMDIDNYSTGMTIYGDLSSVFRHCAAKMPPPLTSLMLFFSGETHDRIAMVTGRILVALLLSAMQTSNGQAHVGVNRAHGVSSVS